MEEIDATGYLAAEGLEDRLQEPDVEGEARVVGDDGIFVGQGRGLAHDALIPELCGVREEAAVALDELLQGRECRHVPRAAR